MSRDYTHRLRELAEAFHREISRIEVVGRALTDAETRRVDALRRAGSLVEQARQALASAPPAPGDGGGGVMRSDVDEVDTDHSARVDDERRGPMDNASLAGDDDTPGYPRGGRGGGVYRG